tara:strand:+ start:1250 stop:1435 length:186 start_codon:yes stop_codon:yes gene_type:complete
VDSSGIPASTSETIKVNNLKITLKSDNTLEIQTYGPWQGSVHEFLDIVDELTSGENGKDKQ